jgi:hypothetical protein
MPTKTKDTREEQFFDQQATLNLEDYTRRTNVQNGRVRDICDPAQTYNWFIPYSAEDSTMGVFLSDKTPERAYKALLYLHPEFIGDARSSKVNPEGLPIKISKFVESI